MKQLTEKQMQKMYERRMEVDKKYSELKEQYDEKGYFVLKGNPVVTVISLFILMGGAFYLAVFRGWSYNPYIGLQIGESAEDIITILGVAAVAVAIVVWMLASTMKKITVKSETITIGKKVYNLYDSEVIYEGSNDNRVYSDIEKYKAGTSAHLVVKRNDKKDKKYNLLMYNESETEALCRFITLKNKKEI